MTGREFLEGIQNLDETLIEEAEFGTFQRGKARTSGKRKLLLILAAALILGTMTAAAAYTRWSATMQFGSYGGEQPSEQIKKQAKESGLSVIPGDANKGEVQKISATDNGVTVTLAQTVMDQYGGRAIFRVEGMKLEEGQVPWAWWDFQIDGKSNPELSIGWGSQFFDGMTADADGNPVYVQNGKPIPRVGKDRQLLLDYQLADGSLEFIIDFSFPQNGERFFGKEMAVTFTGFGIQGEKFEDEDIMTTSGKWELRWTLEGSTEEPRRWTPNAKIGDWAVTLLEAEIGQYSMKTVYRIDEAYESQLDFSEQTGWDIVPHGVRLEDGRELDVFGYNGSGRWDGETHTYTVIASSLNTILDPSRIVGMYFFSGYTLNAQGFREPQYTYVPFE